MDAQRAPRSQVVAAFTRTYARLHGSRGAWSELPDDPQQRIDVSAYLQRA
jgi:hypothetical protein